MISFDSLETTAVAGLVLALGALVVRAVPLLGRWNVPGPVVGGLVVSVGTWALRSGEAVPFAFDTALQKPLMIAFFTTIGFGAGARQIRAGGAAVVKLFVACTLVAVLQDALGLGLAWVLGLPPLTGVLAGSVALTGGPGTALAFAPAFAAAGVPAAASVGLVSALGGIVLGGLGGGPLGTRLIERNRLLPATHGSAATAEEEPTTVTPAALVRQIVVLVVAMAAGAHLGDWISGAGLTLPPYVGAMIVAAILRNVDDRWGFLRLDLPTLEAVGGVALELFLAFSLMTLKIWELAGLAGPLAIMLVVQAAMILLLAAGPVFRLLGRDYDAAVASAGFTGFMLGTTANAMANMDALARRYGPAPRAFLIVPLVGASLVDVTNALLVTGCLNVFGPR